MKILPSEPEIDLKPLFTRMMQKGCNEALYKGFRKLVEEKSQTANIIKVMEKKISEKQTLTLILLTLLFDFGHKSLTHFSTAFKKFSSELKNLVSTKEEEIFLLECISEICEQHACVIQVNTGSILSIVHLMYHFLYFFKVHSIESIHFFKFYNLLQK